MIPPDVRQRVDRIRALNYLLRVLRGRSAHARRALQAAPTAEQFNAALRQCNEVDEQVVKYSNELFDLTNPSD